MRRILLKGDGVVCQETRPSYVILWSFVIGHMIARRVKRKRICRNRHHRVHGLFINSSHEVLTEGRPKYRTRHCDGLQQYFLLFCVFSYRLITL